MRGGGMNMISDRQYLWKRKSNTKISLLSDVDKLFMASNNREFNRLGLSIMKKAKRYNRINKLLEEE